MRLPHQDELLSRAEVLATSVLADAARDCGFPSQIMSPGIRAVTGDGERVAGWAFTVLGSAHDPTDEGPDLLKASAIDSMAPDSVAVWSGGDVEDVCLFGDLLAMGMFVRGVRGVIVDGGVRDVDEIRELGLPVYARYCTPKASTGVWRVRAAEVPLAVKGTLGNPVHVDPGDLIVVDTDGIVCLPRNAAEDILTSAEERLESDVSIRRRIRGGESVEALMRELGRI